MDDSKQEDREEEFTDEQRSMRNEHVHSIYRERLEFDIEHNRRYPEEMWCYGSESLIRERNKIGKKGVRERKAANSTLGRIMSVVEEDFRREVSYVNYNLIIN